MLFAPLVGMIFQVFVQGSAKGLVSARWVALISSVISSTIGFFLVYRIYLGDGLSITQNIDWIGIYGIRYSVGIDGFSALYVFLISVVFPVLIMSLWKSPGEKIKGILGLYLFLQSILIGICCSNDLFLFFFFWAMSCLPFYFLVAIWGGPAREKAAIRFIVTSAVGNALFFIAVLLIYYSVEPHTFSLYELVNMDTNTSVFYGVPIPVVTLAFVLICAGFILRVPIYPLQGWFNFMMKEAPVSVTVAFCGVFIPVGFYAFTKLSYLLFPTEMIVYSNWITVVGALNVLAGSVCLISRTHTRSFLSYLTLVHFGIATMGIASLKPPAVVGSAYLGLAVGIALSAFALLCGIIQNQSKNLEFSDDKGQSRMGGLVSVTPVLALISAIVFASLIGFPGLGGFWGEVMIIIGGFEGNSTVVVVIGMGLIFVTYSILSLYRCIFLGTVKETVKKFADLTLLERAYFLPLVAALIFLGVYPKPLFSFIKPAVELMMLPIR